MNFFANVAKTYLGRQLVYEKYFCKNLPKALFQNVVVMRGNLHRVWQIAICIVVFNKGGKSMANRKRNVQLIIRVTEEERKFIEEKMKLMPTMNLSAYARKMLIDGYILFLDTPEIKAHSAQLQKIGGNINQIVKAPPHRAKK